MLGPEDEQKNPWLSNEGRIFKGRGFKETVCIEMGLVAKSYLTLCDPMDCRPPGSPLSMGFPRQEYWSGFPFSSPGDLPDPGIESVAPAASPALQAEFLTAEPLGKPNA